MTTYKEISAQIEALKRQAEKVRETELASAIASIKATMSEYGITVADLGKVSNKKPKMKVAVSPKYLDPTSGKTWSGRGKPPAWIAGKDRARFSIN